MSGVRSTIKHLETSGAVLLFPSGRVEPDPAILPNAKEALPNWWTSIELFLQKVPETRVVVTIVSGVLAPIFLHNPLIRLWSDVRDPLAIAEVIQIVVQMILKKRFRMTSMISFDMLHTMEELLCDYERICQSVLAKANCLMLNHIPAAEALVE